MIGVEGDTEVRLHSTPWDVCRKGLVKPMSVPELGFLRSRGKSPNLLGGPKDEKVG